MTTRDRTGQVRTVAKDGRGFTARAVTYGTVDSYGSVWTPGCFTACLSGGHRPILCWGHDQRDPIGRTVDWKDQPDGLYLQIRLDDLPSVPRADQARDQLLSGTLTDVSVGFSQTRRRSPTDADLKQWPDAYEIIESAWLDELSVVSVGAVPGALVLAGSVRTAPWTPTRSTFRIADHAHPSQRRTPVRPSAHEKDPVMRALMQEADEALRIPRARFSR